MSKKESVPANGKETTANDLQHTMKMLDKCQEMAEMGSWQYSFAENRTYWSNGLYRLLGHSRETVKPEQKNLLAMVHPDDLPWVEQAYAASFTHGKDHDIIYRINTPSGTVRHIRDRCEHQIASDGKIIQSHGFLQDITELQETRMALQQSREEFDQFANIASHDLQEPLRAITGFLHLLENRHQKQLDDKGRQFIERSVKAGRRMELLIKELLGLARVNTRGAAFKETELDTIYNEVQHRLQFTIEEKEAKVRCAKLPRLAVDGAQIATVFHHLIMNGLQYNESGLPKVTIDCRRQDDSYLFSFSDNGIGIDPQFHQRIFDVVHRLHTQHEYPGGGMGLTMCKKIVERHGGAIWVESAPGDGSVFYVRLPAS